MDPKLVRDFIEKTILDEAKPILNLRYLDMEKYRKFVLINLDTFLDEHNKKQNEPLILYMKKDEKEQDKIDEKEQDKIDVSICGNIINENTKKSAYVKIKGKQIHWSDAALMDTSKLMRLGRQYNKEYPGHKIPRHMRKSCNDIIHHIWNIKFDS